jgi:hypothetical protein
MAIVECPTIVEPVPAPGVTIPAIGRIEAVKSQIDQAPRPYDLAAALLAQVNPVMAPFNFILKLLEAVFAIFDALKSVTNPFKLARALKKVASALASLTNFLPGVPWVKLVRDMIDLFVAILNGIVAVIEAWVRDINSMRNAFVARDNTPADQELLNMIACTKGLLNSSINGVNDTLGAFATALEMIGKLVEILASFMPGGVAQGLVDAIARVVALPAELVGLGTAIDDAESTDDLDAILGLMEDLSLTIGDIAGRLANVSQTITDSVGR